MRKEKDRRPESDFAARLRRSRGPRFGIYYAPVPVTPKMHAAVLIGMREQSMKDLFYEGLDAARSSGQSRVFVFNVLAKLQESRTRAEQGCAERDGEETPTQSEILDRTVATALADTLRDDATSRYPELQSAELEDPQRYIVAFVL